MPTATERMQTERAELHRRWAQLDFLASMYLQLARFVNEGIPSWLQPAFLKLWLQGVQEYAELVQSIGTAVAWLNKADRLVEEGKAEYRPSVTIPGELDLWADPAELGAMPELLLEQTGSVTAESETLGIEPLSTGAVVLIAIGIIGTTASIVSICVAVIERTKTRRAEIRSNLTTVIVRGIETGAVSESFGNRMLETINVWTQAESEKPLVSVDSGGVLTVAAIGGAGYLLYRWLSKPAR